MTEKDDKVCAACTVRETCECVGYPTAWCKEEAVEAPLPKKPKGKPNHPVK